MKKLMCFLLFIPFFTIAQEYYDWSGIKEVKFYDTRNVDYNITSIKSIPKKTKYITYKTREWQDIMLSMSTKGNDVIEEQRFTIVVEFEDGEIIPFQFLPKQKALMDLRKGHFNVVFFGINTFDKIDNIFKKSIECLDNPNCNDVD